MMMVPLNCNSTRSNLLQCHSDVVSAMRLNILPSKALKVKLVDKLLNFTPHRAAAKCAQNKSTVTDHLQDHQSPPIINQLVHMH